jgi:hypothetical protein
MVEKECVVRMPAVSILNPCQLLPGHWEMQVAISATQYFMEKEADILNQIMEIHQLLLKTKIFLVHLLRNHRQVGQQLEGQSEFHQEMCQLLRPQ